MNKILLVFIVISAFVLCNFFSGPDCFVEAKGLSDFLLKNGTVYQNANGQNYTFYYPTGPTSDLNGNNYRGNMCGSSWGTPGVIEAKTCDKTSSFNCCYDYQKNSYYTCGSNAPFCCNQQTDNNILISGCWSNFNQGCILCS